MPRTKEAIYEELLVLRCRRGERDAVEELVRTWEKRLYYFIRRLVDTEQDAWDALQQSWLRVLAGIGRLRDPSALRPWLYRIARHTAFNHMQVRDVRLSARTANGEPVDIKMKFEKGRLAGALGGKS